METSVRKATARDYSSLCDLLDEVDALHRDKLPGIFQRPSAASRGKESYLELITNEDAALLVAEAAEELVGFVQAIVRDAPTSPIFVPRRYAIVESIGVRSAFKNHGTGRMLMDKVQEWSIAKGATSIELNVYEFNEAAISFYERLGYLTLSRKMTKELRDGRVTG